tara:strand:+ start:111 stop:275 length:165 start_codon:yes stop_codon:yes gene_type:complete
VKNYTQIKAYGYEWSWLLWNPDSAKKISKSGRRGALAEANNSTLPPIGNKPSIV